MEDLTWWKLGDIEFLVGISDISSSGNHLVVDNGENCLNTKDIRGKNKTLEHVHLSSLDFIISILLVPKSIFVEPVIGLGFSVERISEV